MKNTGLPYPRVTSTKRYEGLPAAGETVRFEHLEIKILRRTRSRLELARVKRL